MYEHRQQFLRVGLFELKFSFFVLHRLFQRKSVSKEPFYKGGFCINQLETCNLIKTKQTNWICLYDFVL